MFATIIGVDTHFREASALGGTIYDIDPHSRGALAYTALAEEVVHLWSKHLNNTLPNKPWK